jgi:hypothetical protein
MSAPFLGSFTSFGPQGTEIVCKLVNIVNGQTLVWDGTQNEFVNSSAIFPPAPGTVAVVTDTTMTGDGTPPAPLHVVGPATTVVDGVTLSGLGSVALPIQWQGASTDPTTQITGNGYIATPIQWSGAITDTTMTGNGLTATPLSVVPPAAGSVPVFVSGNNTLTGDGSAGAPLSQAQSGNALSILSQQTINNAAVTQVNGSGLVATFNNRLLPGGDYVPATGLYTVPAGHAGNYVFYHNGSYAATNTGDRIIGIQIVQAGFGTSDFSALDHPPNGAGPIAQQVVVPCFMNVGDTAHWTAFQDSGVNILLTSQMGVMYHGI